MRNKRETIGQYAKRTLLSLNDRGVLNSEDILGLQSLNWCSNVLSRAASNFPVLLEGNGDPYYGTRQNRFYAYDRLVNDDGEYYISSQWYNSDRMKFDKWVHRIMNRERRLNPTEVEVNTEEIPTPVVITEDVPLEEEMSLEEDLETRLLAAVGRFSEAQSRYITKMNSIYRERFTEATDVEGYWKCKYNNSGGQRNSSLWTRSATITAAKNAMSHSGRDCKEGNIMKMDLGVHYIDLWMGEVV